MHCRNQETDRDGGGGPDYPADSVELERHLAVCPACRSFHARADEMTCRDVADFLDDYVEGRLETETRAIFQWHYERCVECVDYLASYRAAIALGKSAFAARGDPAPKAPEALLLAILAARERRA